MIHSPKTYHESPISLFHLKILNSDFLTKFWRNYRQSLQRLSTRVFADFGDNNSTVYGNLHDILVRKLHLSQGRLAHYNLKPFQVSLNMFTLTSDIAKFKFLYLIFFEKSSKISFGLVINE